MDKKYILSFDLGTTMIKLILFDEEGKILHEDGFNLKNYNLKGHQVQKATDWWKGIVTLSHRLAATNIDLTKIVGLVSTGQMEDCLLLDEKGEPLTEVFLYSDGRAEEEYEYIVEKLGAENLKNILGNVFDRLMSVNKYLWLQKNRVKYFKNHAHLILGAKDYLNFKLTGQNVTDYTNASTTGMMDIKKGQWSQEIIEELGIERSKLPELKEATKINGEIKEEVARELKFPTGIAVINGSGDLGASTLGAGAWRPGDLYCYLGTTGWLATPLAEFISTDDVFTLRNIEGEGYILAGAVLNAGKPYDWYLSKFLKDGEDNLTAATYQENEEIIADLNAAAEEVFFLPFLNGERSPIKVKENSGAFIGLGVNTDKHLLLRAVLEGVAFSLKHNLNQLGIKKEIKKMNLIGGGSKSKVWPQILANILDLEVNVLSLEMGAPSMGTFLMASRALGLREDYQDFADVYQISRSYYPEEDKVEIYDTAFEKYLDYIDRLF